jgi:hypothetical protein
LGSLLTPFHAEPVLAHAVSHAHTPCSAAGSSAAGGSLCGGEAAAAASLERASAESSLEALLRRTEALQLGSMEADRGRLIAVAERLVQLGASVSARRAPLA